MTARALAAALSDKTLLAAADYGYAKVVLDKTFEALQAASAGCPAAVYTALQVAHEVAALHHRDMRRAYLRAVEADPAL